MPVGSNLAKAAFWAGVIAGASWLFANSIIADGGETSGARAFYLGWKGAGCWLLAIYALLNAERSSGWLIAAVMAFGALGDVVIESSQTNGAAAFIVGHILAIWLYRRERRKKLTQSQQFLALLVVPASVMIGYFLTRDAGVALYALFVSAMAALAWESRFPRYRTGIGAMMFLASDLLIFARMGPLQGAEWLHFLIWPLYFAGQVLIVLGVTQTLAKKTA